MPQGRSLHIALNSVDPDAYGGWSGDLVACELDAADMLDICQAQGLQARSLITAEATAAAVLAELDSAAEALVEGDLLVVTYSGHGGRVADASGDEEDRFDETWVLWDRQLIDDELHQRWTSFAEGVRIVVLSDSCHSGSVVKAQLDGAADAPGAGTLSEVVSRGRFMPDDVNRRDNMSRKALYDSLRSATPGEGEKPLAARVLLLSGCQDTQTSSDGDRNGAFTGALRQVWADGAYEGGYRRFLSAIKRKLPPWQVPNYLALNDPQRRFNSERPFSV